MHFIHCKQALFSIAKAIGKPLRGDHAITAVNRQYDVSRPLLLRPWIGEGDDCFWQDVIFECAPLYCALCKHLG